MSSLKIKKWVNVIYIITKVMFWFSFIGLSISGLSLLFIQFIPAESRIFIVNKLNPFMLQIDETLKYGVTLVDGLSTKGLMISILVAFFLSSLTSTYILLQLSKVLVNVKQDKIFASSNGKRIAYIGYTIIAWSVVHKLAQMYLYLTVMRYVREFNFDIVFSLDLQMLFVGVLIVLLAYIFNYGSFLQDEYDETI